MPFNLKDNDFSLAVGPGSEGENNDRSSRLHSLFYTVNTLLGGNSVRVELTEDDYKVLFNRAIATFRSLSSRSIYQTYGFLNITANVQTYTLHEAVDNVTAIYRKRGLFNSGNGFDYFSQVAATLIYPGSQPGGFMGVATYDFAMQYEETLNRLFARDIRFKFRPETHQIFLLQTPTGPETIAMECSVLKTVHELLADHWANNWLTLMTLAEAKLILGAKRGKFQSQPGAQGQSSLDGDRLLQEGAAEKKALEQAVQDFEDGGVPAFPVMG